MDELGELGVDETWRHAERLRHRSQRDRRGCSVVFLSFRQRLPAVAFDWLHFLLFERDKSPTYMSRVCTRTRLAL